MSSLSAGRTVAAGWRRFLSSTGGGVAIWTALIVPPVAIVSVGAVEIGSVMSDRGKLQAAADSSALSAARELGFSGPVGVTERAQAHALAQLAGVAQHAELSASATLIGERTVQVQVDGNRTSFFGNLLPPGGFRFRGVATATALGSQPLCVVGMQTTSGVNVHLFNTARIQSPGCLVQSNRDVQVDTGAQINAGEVQVTGSASGAITPAALVGAPPLPDPYASMAIAFPAVCNVSETLTLGVGSGTLNPGLHCGAITVTNTATMTLGPGNHFFRGGTLRVLNGATLTGNGVTLFFAADANLYVRDTATISLYGSRSGPWAGFLIVGPRSVGPDFEFLSVNVNRLEGVIYLPNNLLEVEAAGQIAEGSNWTVTLAQRIEVRGATSLVINADYAGSDVPVPVGLGPPVGTRINR